jgi:hypothetical protein
VLHVDNPEMVKMQQAAANLTKAVKGFHPEPKC